MIQPNGIDSPKRHQLSNKNRSTQNFFFFFLLYIHPSIRNPNLHFFIFFSSLTLRKLCSLIPIASRAIFISAKANSFASRRRITIINHRDQYKPKKKTTKTNKLAVSSQQQQQQPVESIRNGKKNEIFSLYQRGRANYKSISRHNIQEPHSRYNVPKRSRISIKIQYTNASPALFSPLLQQQQQQQTRSFPSSPSLLWLEIPHYTQNDNSLQQTLSSIGRIICRQFDSKRATHGSTVEVERRKKRNLFLFLLFFITRKCDKNQDEKKKKSSHYTVDGVALFILI